MVLFVPAIYDPMRCIFFACAGVGWSVPCISGVPNIGGLSQARAGIFVAGYIGVQGTYSATDVEFRIDIIVTLSRRLISTVLAFFLSFSFYHAPVGFPYFPIRVKIPLRVTLVSGDA